MKNAKFIFPAITVTVKIEYHFMVSFSIYKKISCIYGNCVAMYIIIIAFSYWLVYYNNLIIEWSWHQYIASVEL